MTTEAAAPAPAKAPEKKEEREIKRVDGTIVKFPAKRRKTAAEKKSAPAPQVPPSSPPPGAGQAPAAPPSRPAPSGVSVGWIVAGVVVGVGVVGSLLWLLSSFDE